MGNDGFHTLETRRRWLAVGVAGPALAWSGALRAQANPPVVIGWPSPNSHGSSPGGTLPFNEGMAALGWKVGTQYVIDERYAEGQVDRLPALAQELAANKPAIIVTQTSVAARAAAAAAPNTPIVLAFGDPATTGLVTNLARPGGMVTGLSNVVGDLNQKLVELLKESLPKLQRVGFLADAKSLSHGASVKDARRAADRLRVAAVIADMARPEDIEPAMASLAKSKVQAVVMLPSVWFASYHPRIIDLALAQRWPVVGTLSSIPRLGGLFCYGPDRVALQRRSAHYLDRILKGARPGDLPIEQPTTFELVLNLKTAPTLGIVIPPSMRVRATKVIE